MTYHYVIQQTGAETYCAWCPDLKIGAVVMAGTLEEILADYPSGLKETIAMMRAHGHEIPEPVEVVPRFDFEVA